MLPRTFLVVALVIGAGTACTSGTSGTSGTSDTATTEGAVAPLVVETDLGPVEGEDLDGLRVFRAIPYAAPPVGDLRFRPPQEHAGWEEPLETTGTGAACPQPTSGVLASIIEVPDYSEDCLTLNVWTHAEDRNRPVMVWIHGGGYTTGSAGQPLYDGASLARNGDVVVVSLNYRLGPLGFLVTDELAQESGGEGVGNYGILDQVAALQWVQDNISAFGGDPDNVTIFGESAGGSSVCVHLGSPLSEGLFDKAIIQSGGGCNRYRAPEQSGGPLADSAQATGQAFVDRTGCAGSGDILACLRELPVDEVVSATGANALGLSAFGPSIDGVVLTKQPVDALADGDTADVPILTGANADELKLFTLTLPPVTEGTYRLFLNAYAGSPENSDLLLDLYPPSDFASPQDAFETLGTDIGFVCPALEFAASTSDGSAPSFAYLFKHRTGGVASTIGAAHGVELPFVFGTLDVAGQLADPGAAEEALEATMQRYWSTFAHRGHPDDEGTWLQYDRNAPLVALLDEPVETTDEIREGRCAALAEAGLVG
ncbi:MAG: Para-nitrobenzyl esterase [Acidimicrobiales bacterium]|nr:Para-nitrobenzyl esterase [Acidimicrobiales bacterium]